MAESPGLWHRLKLAATVFSRGLPWERAAWEAKASPLAWPSWREGRPDWHLVDIQSYMEEGFSLNSLIFAAISYKCRALTVSPLRAYGGDPDHPEPLPPDHPLSRLLHRPNAFQSGVEFGQLNEVYLNLAGEAFVMLDRPRRGAFPTAMYTLRPDRVYPVPEDKKLRGFLYVPEGKAAQDGVPILPEDMIHVKLPNPLDPLEGMGRGLSPLSPAATSADVDNQITKFLKVFFERGTMISTYAKFDVPMDDRTMAATKARVQELYGGWQNWAEIGVLDNSGEFKRLGMTFEEMGFQGIDERNESRVVMPFGVPGILIGTRYGLERSTHSNYAEARRMFWEDTMIPEQALFEVEYQYFLSQDGAFPLFDRSGVPALQRDVPKLTEAAHRLWQMGIPANIALEAVGLAMGEVPDGDTAFISRAVQTVEQALKPPQPVPAALAGATAKPAAKPSADDAMGTGDQSSATADPRKGLVVLPKGGARKGLDTEAKTLFWKAMDSVAVSWEEGFGDAAVSAFELDKREVLALLGEAKARARSRKATVEWRALIGDVQAYLADFSPETWRATFSPMLTGLIEEQGQTIRTMYGLEFDVRNILAEQWFDDYQLQFAQPISQTSADELAELLEQAQREGWGVETTQNRLESVFRQWATGDLASEDFAWSERRMPPYRREAIARTETIRASAAGSLAMYRAAGVTEKEWLTAMDGRQRDSHGAANGQVRPVDDPFDVGGSAMQFPCDPSAPAAEIVNCLLPGALIEAPRILAGFSASYSGPAIEIELEAGNRLAVTPNHPVLTPAGFIAAHRLHEGNEVVHSARGEEVMARIDHDHHDVPARIEEIVGALQLAARDAAHSRPARTEDFHVDGRFMDGDIQVVPTNRLLRRDGAHPSTAQPVRQQSLDGSLVAQGAFGVDGPLDQFLSRANATFQDFVRVCGYSPTFFYGETSHTETVGFAAVARGDTGFQQPTVDRAPAQAGASRQGKFGFPGEIASDKIIGRGNTLPDDGDLVAPEQSVEDGRAQSEFALEFLRRCAGLVAPQKIVNIRHFTFTGHVYDLQTSAGLYIANGIVVHNCRCALLPVLPEAA